MFCTVSQSLFPEIFFLSLKPGGGGDDCTHHPPTLNRGGMHPPIPLLSMPLIMMLLCQ